MERDRELEQLAALVAAARAGSGGLVLIEGAAGLGKSRLLRWTAEHATKEGLHALRARSGEPERDFSFGVALQLFERLVATSPQKERRKLLAGAAALAAPVFEGEHWGRVRPPQQPAHEGLLHGLFWLAANLAERSPLLLVVDDLHWTDEPSLRFLLYLSRRLEELPVAVVASRRPAIGSRLDAELAGDAVTDRITLAPLSASAVAQLVADTLEQEVGDRFAAATHEATGGNPFLVQALIHSLVDEQVAPTDENATRIAALRPDAIRQQTLVRLARRGEEAVALASAAAILGEGTPLADAAAIAKLDPEAATRAADSLVAAEILARAGPVSFAHPIVWAVVYEEIPAGRRGRWHQRAARLLHGADAPAERVAAQLLPSIRVGEQWAAEALRQAARSAQQAGSPEPAIRYLTRALREPLGRDEHAGVLLELARAKAMLGEESAERDLHHALELLDDRHAQARAHQMLGNLLYTHGAAGRAAGEFERALALVDPDDSLARELGAAYFSAASLVPELAGRAREHIAPLLERPEAADTQAERGALAGAAVYLAMSGGPRDQAIALAHRAWADGRLLAEEGPDGWAWSLVSGAFGWTDEVDAALEVCQQVIEQARQLGSLMAYATASFCAVQPAHMTGRLAEARAFADAALDARRYGWRTYAAALAAISAQVLIDQDELEQAEHALDVLGDPEYGTPVGRAWVFTTRGHLRLLQGRPQDALDDLLTGGAMFEQISGPDASFTTWRASAALAAHQTGNARQAAELLDRAAHVAEQTGTPTHLAAVLRARARIEPDDSVELLCQALAVLERSQARTERIRCLTELGGELRRQGQRARARAMLTDALEQAHQIGARRIEQQARQELTVAGARPRRLATTGADALTTSERRIAEMASHGMGNREIAQALFVTPRTVEQHLYNTYKKLGISSRNQLADALRAT